MGTIYITPKYTGTEQFLQILLIMHGLLLLPLLLPPRQPASNGALPADPTLGISFKFLYAILLAMAAGIHGLNHYNLLASLPDKATVWTKIYATIFTNAAQSSISLDVLWVGISVFSTWVSRGSPLGMFLRLMFCATVASLWFLSTREVNWGLVATMVPGIILLGVGGGGVGLNSVRAKNLEKRRALLDTMGITETGVVPGTDVEPPRQSGKKLLVGFWHPYW
jgi:alpha-1,2-mannosyltransferase